MKNTLTIFVIAVSLGTVPASATVFSTDFTGVVSQTQGATGQSVGSTISGHFDLDNATGNFLDFSIAGMSVASGFNSSAAIAPGGFDAFYTAQLSPVSAGGTSNSSFSLDLSSLTSWPAFETAFSLLTDSSQLMTNLDTVSNPLSAFPSSFNYYTANASGTGIVSLTADLTSIATTTPEPASFGLMGGSLLAAYFFLRRRKS